MMAYFAMLSRDFKYLSLTRDLADMMPLGAGALAGTTWPLDQAYVAKRLKFTTLYENRLCRKRKIPIFVNLSAVKQGGSTGILWLFSL